MKTTAYQQAKQQLKNIAQEVKRSHPTDKPAQRQTINDYCDMLFREGNLSEAQRDRLSNYVCKLHPR